jgi:hypothetical protein
VFEPLLCRALHSSASRPQQRSMHLKMPLVLDIQNTRRCEPAIALANIGATLVQRPDQAPNDVEDCVTVNLTCSSFCSAKSETMRE